MLYILPTMELVRSIQINLNNHRNNINKLYANNIFQASFPIPVIVIYSSGAKIFKTYSINGLNINEKDLGFLAAICLRIALFCLSLITLNLSKSVKFALLCLNSDFFAKLLFLNFSSSL